MEKEKGGETSMRKVLLVVCLAVFVQGVSAYTVSPLVIDPTGALTPNTPVNITFTISNPQSGSNGFPNATDIEMYSELWKPIWSIESSEGVQRPLPDRQSGNVRLSDWEPSAFNQNTAQDRVKIVLSGYAPYVDQTMRKTLIGISQLDSGNRPIPGSNRTITPVIINTCCISPIPAMRADLQTFRDHIDEKAAMGIDTSAAEAKYNLAQQKIASSEARLPTQYPEAFYDLNIAHTAIDEGETALDKAWAESEIATARVPVANTDAVIRWFKGNTSTAAEPGLDQVIAKRDIAAKYLDAAGDELARGNFSGARADAREAYRMGNESYHDAVGLQTETVCGPGCGFPFVPIVTGIGAIIIAIGAFFLWKKRK